MDQAGIPKRRQATPQAPPRDFKPRKNGTPAVPSTPPANVPRAMPQPAPQITPPPMQGAQRSMGQSPAPVQAPPQQQARRSGGFNPMQGPMGANVERARQAAASMYEVPVQRQAPSMPQAAQQPRMQEPMQQAPKRAPAQRIERAAPATPAQEAALSMFGPMQARGGKPLPSGDGFDVWEAQKVMEANERAQEEQAQKEANAAKLAMQAASAMPEYQSGSGLVGPGQKFLEQAQAVLLSQGAAGLQSLSGFPQAIDILGGLEPDEMQRVAEILNDPALNQSLESLPEYLVDQIAGILGGSSKGLYTDEELQAQAQTVIGQADEAKAALAQQMAMRGMGASGLYGSGFGNIDSNLIDTLNDLALQNKALGTEVDLKKLGISSSMLANLLGDETRRMIFEEQLKYQKEQDAMSNADIIRQNLAAALGGSKWDEDAYAAAGEAFASGVPLYEIEKSVEKNAAGELVLKEGGLETLQGLTAEAQENPGASDKVYLNDWAQSMLDDPGQYAEGSEAKETLDAMYADWMANKPKDTYMTFDDPMKWLEYYWGDPTGDMAPAQVAQYLKEKEAAERAALEQQSYSYAPEEFVPYIGPDGTEMEWLEMDEFQRKAIWEKYWAGELDAENPLSGPIVPEADPDYYY